MKISIQKLLELVKKAKSEPSTEDLMKRPCCGSGCTNCPYSLKHKKGNTNVGEELKKEAKIVKDKKSGKWILYTKDGSRILGKHENAQDAYKQEYAIQKSMEKKSEDTQAKEDPELSTVTKPNKTPRNGFIRDPKTNRLMVQDRRFNQVQPKEEVVKQANAFKDLTHALRTILRAKTLQKGLGADHADRFIMKELNVSSLPRAKKMFDTDIKKLGISPRLKPNILEEKLLKLNTPKPKLENPINDTVEPNRIQMKFPF